MNYIDIKNELLNRCNLYIEEKISNAQDAIDNAQRSANEETKSSVGDKYETGRAMLQMERNKFEIQLKESLKLKEFLDQVNVNKQYDSVQVGSVVLSEKGNFFIAINSGKQFIGDDIFFTISLASPVGKVLAGKKVGEEFIINGSKNKIKQIF